MTMTTHATRRVGCWLAAVVCWLPGTVSAQDACGVLFKQAAQVMGTPAGKPEDVTPTKGARACSVRSSDGSEDLALTTTSSPSAAQSLTMAKMIAAQSKDPDEAMREEPDLGASAFSLRDTDSVTFMMGDAARMLSLRLSKDRGVNDADVERARQLAKQVLGAK